MAGVNFWILEFTVIIDMALKRAKYDLNGDKIAIFATKSQISTCHALGDSYLVLVQYLGTDSQVHKVKACWNRYMVVQ